MLKVLVDSSPFRPVDQEKRKRCFSCGEWKVYREFRKKAENKDGFENRCKRCSYEKRTGFQPIEKFIINASDVDLAWCAGFLDGEGSYQGYRYNRDNKSPVFHALDKLSECLGGNVRINRSPSARAALAKFSRTKYEWSRNGVYGCLDVVKAIYPYIVVKKEVVDIYIEYLETFNDSIVRNTKLPDKVINRRTKLIETMNDTKHKDL